MRSRFNGNSPTLPQNLAALTPAVALFALAAVTAVTLSGCSESNEGNVRVAPPLASISISAGGTTVIPAAHALSRQLGETVHLAALDGDRVLYTASVVPAGGVGAMRRYDSRLQFKGFLTHPQTSSGRPPTDKGYRFHLETVVPAFKSGQGPYLMGDLCP